MTYRVLGFLLLMITSATASEWIIDPKASTLSFSGTQTSTPFEGHFTRFDAAIEFNPQAPEEAAINVTIDTSSAKTGNAERDAILPGPDWFDVTAYPTAAFTTTAVVKAENGYTAVGTLTLKGTAQEINLPFDVRIVEDTARAVGSVTINREDYSIGTGPLGPMVGNDITIKFNLTATR